MNEDEVLWTVKDVAAFLQVPERKIWNRLRTTSSSRSGIPSVTLDGHPRFIPSHIRTWAERFGRTLRKLTPQEEMRRWHEINPDDGAIAQQPPSTKEGGSKATMRANPRPGRRFWKTNVVFCPHLFVPGLMGEQFKEVCCSWRGIESPERGGIREMDVKRTDPGNDARMVSRTRQAGGGMRGC